uniref:Uncharacterized protein n=1 Tax=Anguilla anguilla TaxID=7936 RepID=A0A0E9Y1Y7_ANGAN
MAPKIVLTEWPSHVQPHSLLRIQ